MYTALPFKKELATTNHWLSYGLVVLILGLILWLLNRYCSHKKPKLARSPLLKVIPLHQKTKVYVVEYQTQCFLIADNQNAIAIHELKNGVHREDE